jgi:predicted secreted protein
VATSNLLSVEEKTMERNVTHLGVLVLVGALIGGLTNLLPERAFAGEDAKVVSLSAKDNGKAVELTKGHKLELRLPIQGGTGYLWGIEENDRKVLLPVEKPAIERPKKAIPGAQQMMLFRFEAKEPGTSELELHYRRPFEKDKKAAKTFKAKVTVK